MSSLDAAIEEAGVGGVAGAGVGFADAGPATSGGTIGDLTGFSEAGQKARVAVAELQKQAAKDAAANQKKREAAERRALKAQQAAMKREAERARKAAAGDRAGRAAVKKLVKENPNMVMSQKQINEMADIRDTIENYYREFPEILGTKVAPAHKLSAKKTLLEHRQALASVERLMSSHGSSAVADATFRSVFQLAFTLACRYAPQYTQHLAGPQVHYVDLWNQQTTRQSAELPDGRVVYAPRTQLCQAYDECIVKYQSWFRSSPEMRLLSGSLILGYAVRQANLNPATAEAMRQHAADGVKAEYSDL